MFAILHLSCASKNQVHLTQCGSCLTVYNGLQWQPIARHDRIILKNRSAFLLHATRYWHSEIKL